MPPSSPTDTPPPLGINPELEKNNRFANLRMWFLLIFTIASVHSCLEEKNSTDDEIYYLIISHLQNALTAIERKDIPRASEEGEAAQEAIKKFFALRKFEVTFELEEEALDSLTKSRLTEIRKLYTSLQSEIEHIKGDTL